MLSPPTQMCSERISALILLAGIVVTLGLFLRRRDPNVLPIGIFATLGLSMMPTAIGWMRRNEGVQLIPELWQRPAHWSAGIMFAGGAVSLALGFWLRNGYAGFLGMLVTIVLSISAITVARVLIARLRRRLLGNAGLLCPKCRYALWGLDTPGQCPECGRPYEFRSVQEYWAQSMNMPELLIEPDPD